MAPTIRLHKVTRERVDHVLRTTFARAFTFIGLVYVLASVAHRYSIETLVGIPMEGWPNMTYFLIGAGFLTMAAWCAGVRPKLRGRATLKGSRATNTDRQDVNR